MYSVFFKMSEIFSNVLFGIAERLFLKEKPFKEEAKYTLRLDGGWRYKQAADKYFLEFRGRWLNFKPRFAVLQESDSIKTLPKLVGKTEPERVYISWKELASDEFFKDVDVLFRMVGEREKVEPTTSKGG